MDIRSFFKNIEAKKSNETQEPIHQEVIDVSHLRVLCTVGSQ